MGEPGGGRFGKGPALSSDGTRLVVGSERNDNAWGADPGHVRTFDCDATSADWVQVGPDLDGSSAGEAFGNTVSLDQSGRRLAVGGYGFDGGSSTGIVIGYDFESVTSSWIPIDAGV